MKTEMILAEWAAETTYRDLPAQTVEAMKVLTRTILGATVAGATSDGCAATVDQVMEWGGRPEATVLLYGGKVPAHAAAMANSVLARALDICDGAMPGQHIGTTAVPTGLAIAELVGGVSGEEFITALAVGSEIAVRLGWVSRLDGFDPTGVCSQFSSAIVAAKLLKQDPKKMLHSMALAFNRAGSSFQCNIDGVLAVRMIEGFVSQNSVVCAQLAQRGVTGPQNWLSGVWGYYHLFCKDQVNDELLTGQLGSRWFLEGLGYKTAPSCGATITSTDAALELVHTHGVRAADIEHVDIHMASEQTFTLVGHEFRIGDNPQVNAQFNVRYCVANVFQRGSAELEHFSDPFVTDPAMMALTGKIQTHLAPQLAEGRPELGARVRLDVRLKDGRTLSAQKDTLSGYPPLGMSEEEHLRHFHENVAYGGLPLAPANVSRVLSTVKSLERLADARDIVPLMISEQPTRLRA